MSFTPSEHDAAKEPGTQLSIEGRLFAGRFQPTQRVQERLGVSTWLGTDLADGANVVLKISSIPRLTQDAPARLEHEAIVLHQLKSRWIAPLLHCGREDSFFYLVIPFVSGITLEHRLTYGALSVPDALTVGKGLLAGLQDVHAAGVIHRDIKPSNVMVDGESPLEQVTLIDFGLALSDRLDVSLQQLPAGTVRYLSPEQAGLIDSPVSVESDLYSVGVVLFECLSGRAPFQGTVGEVLRQHLTVQPDLLEVGKKVPRALEELLERLLKKSPQERYQSAGAALADLEAISSALDRGLTEPRLVIGLSDRRETVAEPSFVGRESDLQEMESAVDQAFQGRGGLTFIEAESGAGKSKLLNEVARRSIKRGARVFSGQGMDRSAQLPFYVLAGVAREVAAVAKADPSFAEGLRSRLGPYRATLCVTLPPLAEILVPGLPADALQVEAAMPEATGKSRSIRATVELFGALGSPGMPAVLLFDDCQWADELTISALAAGRLTSLQDSSNLHTAVVAAFRTEEVGEEHPLRRAITDRKWVMGPLSNSDTRLLVSSMLSGIPEAAMNLVLRLSRGNPFIASALVRGLVESGTLTFGKEGDWKADQGDLAEVRLSRRAAFILARRLAILSEESRHLLAIGATLGRGFELEHVATLAGCSLEQAGSALQEPLRRHIVWASGDGGRYSFVHDKLRETLLDLLSPEERRALHWRAALHLQSSNQPFEVAYHFDAAGDFKRALPFALEAAESARNRSALAVAERYYRISERGAEGGNEAKRRAIFEGLGDVLMLQGRYADAAAPLHEARRLALTGMDRARAEGKLGELMFKQGNVDATREAMERALRLLGRYVPRRKLGLGLCIFWAAAVQGRHTAFGSPRPRNYTGARAAEDRLAIRLYGWLVRAHFFQGARVRCLCVALLELNLADRYPHTPEIAQAYAGQGPVMSIIPWFNRALSFVRKSLEMRRAAGDVWGQGQSLSFYGLVLYAASRFSECVEASFEAVRLLEQTGADQWEMNLALGHIALGLYRMGKLPEALEAARDLVRRGVEMGDLIACGAGLDIMAKASGGTVWVDVSKEFARAESSGDLQTLTVFLQARATWLIAADEPAKAVAVLERAAGLIRKKKLRREYVAPVLPWLATALREEALQVSEFVPKQRAALLRRAQTAAREGERMARSFRNNLPHALRERGLIAAMQGQSEPARQAFDESLAVAERQKMAHEAALTRLARAQVGTAVGWNGLDEQNAAEQALQKLYPAKAANDHDLKVATPSLLDRFPRVLEAGRRIASALDKATVFAAVREAAMALLRADDCAVVEAGAEDRFEGMALSRTTLRRAFESQRLVTLSEGIKEDVTESVVFSGANSVLCAPILVQGKSVAAFYVTNRQLSGLFGKEEERLAEFIATLAGAALENAKNFELAKEALRKRDEFIAIASHEMQTPLTPLQIHLQGMLNSVKAGVFDPEKYAAKLEIANRQVRRLGKWGEELLDLSQLSQRRLTLNLESVELNALVKAVVDRFQPELDRARCPIVVRCVGEIDGRWNYLRLEQVFTNLLSNAVKYGAGKPIQVVVDRDEASAWVSVKDEGMGISPEDQQRIFEKFERAVSVHHYGGFGLGLWIAREVVQALGGTIQVDSHIGEGSTFKVQLPLMPPALTDSRSAV